MSIDIEEFNCVVCFDLAEDAVETTCCHQILCENCSQNLDSCPVCRKESLETQGAYAIRRVIGKMLTACPDCSETFQRANLKDHTFSCPHRKLKCTFPQCTFAGEKEDIIKHVVNQHPSNVLRNLAKIFQKTRYAAGLEKAPEDVFQPQKNRAGLDAIMAENGKLYCGGHYLECSCCSDGICGPNGGCNCKYCMELEIKERKLPKGYLVNKHGGSARRGTTGNFYCGKRVMGNYSDNEAYCGPDEGDNCNACSILDELTRRKSGYYHLL